jgi:hypothetical protein
MNQRRKLTRVGAIGLWTLIVLSAWPAVSEESSFVCHRTIKAQVIALDQPWMWNRLGAAQPGGMIYALREDVVKLDGGELADPAKLSPEERQKLVGDVRLRDDKRARPLVLRANKGDCLEITFWNLLSPGPPAGASYDPSYRPNVQAAVDISRRLDVSAASAATRWAGLHATGIELVGSINSDGSWIGGNSNSLAKPGEILVYKWYATEEGTYLIYSPADMESGQQAREGLFGAINVEPEGAEWYRSQVTHDDLDQATLTKADLKQPYFTLEEAAVAEATPSQGPPAHEEIANAMFTKMALVNREADRQSTVDVYVNNQTEKGGGQIYSSDRQPLIYYHAVYKPNSKRPYREGLPVLQMLQVKPLGDPLYNQPLPKSPSGYVRELQDLDSGIIPLALLDIFANSLKITLSASAQAEDQYHYSWLITDQGRAYFVQALETEKSGEYQLKIFNAELDLLSSDLTAVITGPNAGRFSYSNTSPTFRTNPASPDRRQPYREFTIIYHQAFFATQAFAQFVNENLVNVIQAGGDNFAINYGSAAIGPEIVANRLGVGPMGNPDAVDLKFEEFFLSSFAVGDPAMVVDVPANTPNALVSDPDDHREVRTQVPPGSPAAVYAALNGQPRPATNVPPQSDDFAPLSKAHATKAFFPDDPSNVYHSYMDDHVKFRILHAGAGPAHVHHLHAHQWLHSPDSDDGHYLDSQLIIPGSAYTLEIAYGGSGNRNKTVGDSIFHCHFYPHFAQGMWALWRVHDVFEEGTTLDQYGIPVAGVNRALPDGEIERGTPIPAIVPLPTLAMAPMPAKVELTDLAPWFGTSVGQGRRVKVLPELEPDKDAQGKTKKDADGKIIYVVEKDADGHPVYKNPGYPFFIPGVSGHRSPHPPLGFAWLENPNTGEPIVTKDKKKVYLDGGLPRHLVLDGTLVKEFQTRWDFTKDFVALDKQGKLQPGGGLEAFRLPEEGTPVELAAMKQHARRTTPSSQPNGQPGNFILNGLPPTPGAPYADPSVTDFGDANIHKRRYQAAVIQVNAVLNKEGWHYPQQRMVSLWQDVAPTIGGKRPPQPLFFRSNTQDTIQFWHTNLVPNYYELDDFQVRTPTDIIGEHIHLVKFDVTSSDGASNGFNYESGTFSPEEVRERIYGINEVGGLYAFDPGTGYVDKSAPQQPLTVKKVNDYYPPPGSNVTLNDGTPVITPAGESVFGKPPEGGDEWDGAQTTVELWAVDPLLNNEGVDRTLRTVFTHDHFSPSTHQQAGLYAGLVIEPDDSLWYLPEGTRMNTRLDGGPTSWHGYVVPKDPKDSYREFMLEFQDLQLAYTKESRSEPSSLIFDPRIAQPAPQTPSAAFELSQAITKLKINAFKYYVNELNYGRLPVGNKGPAGPEVRGFTDLFLEFGVPLSPKATVRVDQKGVQWTITEAPGAINGGVQYIVHAVSQDQVINGVTVSVIVQLLVYTPDITPGWSDPTFALNSPSDNENTLNGAPFPQLVSQNQIGTYSLNYRNEPVPFRLANLSAKPPVVTPMNIPEEQSDPALVFASIPRADPNLNLQPDGNLAGFPTDPLVPNAKPDDPYTPLLEAYANDKVQIRTLVGAHTQSHALEIHGVKWLSEPSYKNSGYHNAQLMGLSEHFEMLFDLPSTTDDHEASQGLSAFADYFYSPSSDIVGLSNGLWGIMRSYGSVQPGVTPLPNNPTPIASGDVDLFEQGYTAAKQNAEPTREFDVTAVTAAALKNGKLVFNGRAPGAELSTPYALIFVRTSDLMNGNLKDGAPVEPLILRAAAGEWIKVTVRNGFDSNSPVFKTTNTLPYGTPFNRSSQSQSGTLTSGSTSVTGLTAAAQLFGTFVSGTGIVPGTIVSGTDSGTQITLSIAATTSGQQTLTFSPALVPLVPLRTSYSVGLHPQLVAYNPVKANGLVVGFNPKDKLVAPGQSQDFYWYAGEVTSDETGKKIVKTTPIEFGATNLVAADQLIQPQFGMVGALIIEPEGSTWVEDINTRAAATVTSGNKSFRDFVVVDQNMVANSNDPNSPLNAVAGGVVGAINFRSEPFTIRNRPSNAQDLPQPAPQGFSQAFSNSLFNPPADPETPVFVASAGMPTRFRLVIPSTTTSNGIVAPPVFIVHGHNWQEEPYIDRSTKIGDNRLSEHFGAAQGGPNQKFDLLFPSAGGADKVPGDYLYTTYQTAGVLGTWGLFRVTKDKVAIEKAQLIGSQLLASGSIQAATAQGAGQLPKQLQAFGADAAHPGFALGKVDVSLDGKWTLQVHTDLRPPATIQVTEVGANGKTQATAAAKVDDGQPRLTTVSQ